jgi:hypothetical protein
MEFKLPATPTTPLINFDLAQHYFVVSGRSTLENPFDFYENVNGWLKTNLSMSLPCVTIDLDFEYVNTSSWKCLLETLRKIVDRAESRTGVTLNWFYQQEDDDMRDMGEDFSESLGIPFNFREKPF